MCYCAFQRLWTNGRQRKMQLMKPWYENSSTNSTQSGSRQSQLEWDSKTNRWHHHLQTCSNSRSKSRARAPDLQAIRKNGTSAWKGYPPKTYPIPRPRRYMHPHNFVPSRMTITNPMSNINRETCCFQITLETVALLNSLSLHIEADLEWSMRRRKSTKHNRQRRIVSRRHNRLMNHRNNRRSTSNQGLANLHRFEGCYCCEKILQKEFGDLVH